MNKLTQNDAQQIRDALKPDLDAFEKRVRNDIASFRDDILKEVKNLQTDVAITIGYAIKSRIMTNALKP